MTIWLVAIIRAKDCSETGSRDEQGAARTASCSVRPKPARTSGPLMFPYLRAGKKQVLLKDELSLGSELEGAAGDENVWRARCLLQNGGNGAGWVGHLQRWEVCILSETVLRLLSGLGELAGLGGGG